jgi:hypothetical protein
MISILLLYTLAVSLRNNVDRVTSGKYYHNVPIAIQTMCSLSTMIGYFSTIGTLVLVFVNGNWYYPIVLFLTGLLGSMMLGLIWGTAESIFGPKPIISISFLAWPALAIYSLILINNDPL